MTHLARSWRWVVLGVLLALSAAVFLSFDLHQHLSLAWLQERRDALFGFRGDHPWFSAFAYFLVYLAMVSLWLPGATVMTLLAGGIFGFWQGLFLVSFASSLGATAAMLLSRKLIGEWVQHRYRQQLHAMNEEFAKDGAFYLFALRMVPLLPFVLINILMGLTPIRARTFYWVSQVGMLAGSALYVFTGAHMGSIGSLDDIISVETGLLLLFLGLSPIAFRKLMEVLRKRRAVAP